MKVKVYKTYAEVSEKELLTSGMVGKTIETEYSGDWDGLTKIAVFSNGIISKDVVNPSDTIEIPWEILEEHNRTVSVGFYGYLIENDEKVLAIPTVYVDLGTIRRGTDPSGDPSNPPSPDVTEQILTLIGDLSTIRSGAALGATAVQPNDLSAAATSGSYNDLSNKPTIPSAVTEQTVSGWGFTKNMGTYSKPASGIPKGDLSSALQTSLDKADTALQSHQDISGKSDVVISLDTNITPTQVATAISQGKTVVITTSHETFGSLSFEAWNVATNLNLVISNTTASVLDSWATISLQGNLSTDSWALVSEFIATSQDATSKLDISQGVSHSGEFLVVGSDGNVTTMTMSAWQGGSY